MSWRTEPNQGGPKIFKLIEHWSLRPRSHWPALVWFASAQFASVWSCLHWPSYHETAGGANAVSPDRVLSSVTGDKKVWTSEFVHGKKAFVANKRGSVGFHRKPLEPFD